MNIIFHINENAKWKAVLDNVSNVIKSCNENEESFQIEVLANGEAVASLKNKAAANLKMSEELTKTYQGGAIFTACRNSLNKFAICEEDLLYFVQVVPAGVIEIAKKQEEGYSYIKP